MTGDGEADGADLETRLGHRFADPSLLRLALTHRSVSGGAASGLGRGRRRGVGSNERLEFIGDRVLGLAVAEWLLERFPDEQEGGLGSRHAHLVSREALARVAVTLGLEAELALAPDALAAGVGALANVLADAAEAVLGALYLDGGIAPARAVVRRYWADELARDREPPKDAKTALQEWLLARGRPLPDYVETGREGPSHAPVFRIEARSREQVGAGEAASKRMAEQIAAAALLGRLQDEAAARRRKRKEERA